jgi:hypothetical protein
MAGVLAYLFPADVRHEARVRAGLALLAEGLVNLRSCGAVARAFLKPE